jgi:hypothetical protein
VEKGHNSFPENSELFHQIFPPLPVLIFHLSTTDVIQTTEVTKPLNGSLLSPQRANTESYNTRRLMLFGQVAGADCENYAGNIFCGDHVEILGDTCSWYVELTLSY